MGWMCVRSVSGPLLEHAARCCWLCRALGWLGWRQQQPLLVVSITIIGSPLVACAWCGWWSWRRQQPGAIVNGLPVHPKCMRCL